MSTPTREQWTAAAAVTTPRDLAFIDGAAVPALSGRTTPSISPSTGRVLAHVAECGEEDVDRAVRSARAAFGDGRWSNAAPRERKAVLLRLADLVEQHADELALLDTLDAGKLIADTRNGDVPASAAILRWYAEAIDKVYGEVAPTGHGDLALVTREPLGVIGAVIPWNYPLETAVWKLGPALAAGNSVVLKPAEESPLSALRLAELAVEAGVPHGVLNVVPGRGEVAGRALGLHADVDAIAFTGSTAVGKLFLQYAGASNLKQVWLECGGKSPDLVFADAADLAAAADGVVAGIFTNGGQVCSATSRLLVARAIKDELLDAVVTRTLRIVPGDPLDPDASMGPLVSDAHADRVVAAMTAGALAGRVLTGGGRLAGAPTPAYVEPTVIDDVDPASALAREEVFGPVLAVTTFDDEAQAVALANDSPYGLAASVWTDSLPRALRVSRALSVGTVSVNTTDALDVSTPFGGRRQSGAGRDLSLHALHACTATKTTWISYGR